MPVRVSAIVLELDEVGQEPALLLTRAARTLGIDPAQIVDLRIVRRSLDARGSRAPRFVFTVDVTLAGGPRQTLSKGVSPLWKPGAQLRIEPRPVIVGMGPAGMFCALALLEAGIAPVILERGSSVEVRKLDVARLYRLGELNADSNVSFGEGGAGTFTDGKLSARTKDRAAMEVLRLLTELGEADRDILITNRPHLGSERLPSVVATIRRRLIEAGCEIRFGARVQEVLAKNGSVTGVRLAGGETLESSAVVLAPGNAARELFASLAGVPGLLVAKPFAVGFRVEHPQQLIDSVQYGRWAGHPALPAAEYDLAVTGAGRGVWSFCMCPGGVVVPTPTQPGGLCVNGMSSSRRAGRFANSAIVTELKPEDAVRAGFGDDALAGMRFQENVERLAYASGGDRYKAPAQRLTDLLERKVGHLPSKSSYPRGLTPANLGSLYPGFVTEELRQGIVAMGKRMRGFVTEDAVLIGAETRTSSPVSFPRDEEARSTALDGLYPCGEGCGHGGGIVSAAVDGLRVGRSLARRLGAPAHCE